MLPMQLWADRPGRNSFLGRCGQSEGASGSGGTVVGGCSAAAAAREGGQGCCQKPMQLWADRPGRNCLSAAAAGPKALAATTEGRWAAAVVPWPLRWTAAAPVLTEEEGLQLL